MSVEAMLAHVKYAKTGRIPTHAVVEVKEVSADKILAEEKKIPFTPGGESIFNGYYPRGIEPIMFRTYPSRLRRPMSKHADFDYYSERPRYIPQNEVTLIEEEVEV